MCGESGGRIMRPETPAVKAATWRRMYRRKASLAQRPTSMMANTGTPARYMAMAAPARMEWVPTSEGAKPRQCAPS